jgi:hypothetical protein
MGKTNNRRIKKKNREEILPFAQGEAHLPGPARSPLVFFLAARRRAGRAVLSRHARHLLLPASAEAPVLISLPPWTPGSPSLPFPLLWPSPSSPSHGPVARAEHAAVELVATVPFSTPQVVHEVPRHRLHRVAPSIWIGSQRRRSPLHRATAGHSGRRRAILLRQPFSGLLDGPFALRVSSRPFSPISRSLPCPVPVVHRSQYAGRRAFCPSRRPGARA